MVGFLLHHGADPEDIYRHYRNEFYDFLSEGDLSGARDLTEEANFIPKPRFPLASSFLQDNKSPLRYSREMAFDGDLATAGVEGRDGPGIAEKIAFEVAPNSGQIEIYPGYGVKEYHSSNNRLKQAVFTLYVFKYLMTPLNGMAYTVEKIQSWELDFSDLQCFQNFPISVSESKDTYSLYFGVLEIRGTFPG